MIIADNLIDGKLVKGSVSQSSFTPIDGSQIVEINALNEDEMGTIFKTAKEKNKAAIKTDFSELDALADYINNNYQKFLSQIIYDAAFTKKDSDDLVKGTVEFCRDYRKHLEQIGNQELVTNFSFNSNSAEKISFTSDAYGLIVATTPRNTPLITELTIIIHALWSGNTLVLRPSPGVAGTVKLLIDGMMKTFSSETLSRLFIVFADARKFIEVGMNYADIIHYVGSSKYLENTLIAGIKNGVKVLVDGDGCSLVIIDKTADLKQAVKACYEGFIRCNTQICISIRAIIVEEGIYQEFKNNFIQLVESTTVNLPNQDDQPDMGPLFSSAQVNAIFDVASKYNIVSGEAKAMELGENYMKPIVVELNDQDTNFLTESVFGPIVGITSYTHQGWKHWLTDNPINLTDALFSNNDKFIKDFLNVSNSPRRVINIDPTVESVFEPWGAFLPSGWNDVTYWFHKYRNFYQLISINKS